METVDVHYTVPVTVAVDHITGEIVKVIVWDEEVELDSDEPQPSWNANQVAAVKAAEDPQNPWPAWQFGV